MTEVNNGNLKTMLAVLGSLTAIALFILGIIANFYGKLDQEFDAYRLEQERRTTRVEEQLKAMNILLVDIKEEVKRK